MTDHELLQEFSRIIPVLNGIALEVGSIHWKNSYTPELEWSVAEVLPEKSDEATISLAKQRLLDNPKFFGICKECHTRKPVGWMHKKGLCQSCASANHGVVY